jgi:hypothetical protein
MKRYALACVSAFGLATVAQGACGGGGQEASSTTSGGGTITGANASATSTSTSTSTSGLGGAGGAAPTPHVAIHDDRLWVDGTPTFLYGGDLHYFRVRDANYDAAATQAKWAETVDLMKAAGMNLVSTYVPWDFHNTAQGQWDFTGARDLAKFFDTVCSKGMHLIVKPGPLITAEWPAGFGTYGAVPAWWKTAHQDALIRNAKGDLWTYSPTGDDSQRQPTYLHPTYLSAVEEWFDHVLPIAKPYLKGCLVGLQVDNETNLYWGDRYGDVDYSDTALAHYRDFLKTQYGTISALNTRYGTSYGAFSEVQPPTSAPGSGGSERPKNPWYADWYFAGQAYSHDYLVKIRAMLEARGFHEPDVLFLTNDSPFALLFTDLKLHNVLLHDGLTKDSIGLSGLDLYPKQFPTNSNLQDQPFQADYFTRLYDHWGDIATGKQDFAYAAELQGGFYAYPLVGHPDVKPEATDQLLARTVGHGLKGGSFYVIRDGINADGSAYDYLSAIDAKGKTTPRYDVMKRWGGLITARGDDLMGAKEVTNRVAILMNGRYAAPQGGLLDDMQRLTSSEYPAMFGWLMNAGFNPEVRDARQVTAAELAKDFRVVLYQNPDFVDDATAQLLLDYAKAGGVLVDFLWPGRTNDAFQSSAATTALSTMLFPAKDEGSWVWLGASRSGTFNADFPAYQGELGSYWYASFWSDPTNKLSVIGWERTEPFGDNGNILGYVANDANMTRAFVGTNVYARFNQSDYYDLDTTEISHASDLARYLLGLGGETAIVETGRPRQLVWARKSMNATYLFVVNDDKQAQVISVALRDAATLGISPAVNYRVTEALSGNVLQASASGSSLISTQIPVTVSGLGTAVLVIEPTKN